MEKCKGACCVEGDSGAPITAEEIEIIQKDFAKILPFLDENLIKNIEKYGFYENDEGGFATTCDEKTGACNFLVFENGISFCGIEKANKAGATEFKKPISCHLYPIREIPLKNYVGLNYHEWSICKHACTFGERENVRIYQFLKEPLIRRFGEEWYQNLCEAIPFYNEHEK